MVNEVVDRARVFATDPHADQRLINALAEFGLHQAAPKPSVSPDASSDERLAWISQAEQGFEALFTKQAEGLEPIEGVERESVEIAGYDGNRIRLQIHYPKRRAEELPAVLHIHGGGMTMLSTFNPTYVHFRDALASKGLVVVGVEFRNAGGALGPHPFPAGINDVHCALTWVRSKRDEIGFKSITLVGESGGAHLSISCSLRCVSDGQLDCIDGVYAMCPMLFDPRKAYPESLASHEENANYFIDQVTLQICANAYDPGGAESENPLCWPMQAQKDLLKALPRHLISVNELDPLRDEGLEFYQSLRAAGVECDFRVVSGTCHSGDCNFPNVVGDLFWETVNDIARFTSSHRGQPA